MNRGFTIIEILVTITIFSVAVVGFLGLFSSAFRYQRESLDVSYLLNNGSFLTEYISRALRVAQKELNNPPDCLSSRGLNYEVIQAGEGIRFINYQGDCQEFYLENNKLKVKKLGSSQSLTPSDLRVENLKFEVSGESQDDFLQPRVTFVLELKTTGESSKIFNLQTTVSQRDLDIQY